MRFAPLGDSALVVKFGASIEAGALAAVGDLASALRAAALPGVTDVVPAYTTVTLFYDPAAWIAGETTPYAALLHAVAGVTKTWRMGWEQSKASSSKGRHREIPVCYGTEFGPDLVDVAAHARLTAAEVIARHSGAEYRVQAIGFAPGFPYLVGLPKELETPRRSSPRTEVPAGTVGIGGAQTGVYPMKSPGGWQLIGRTPMRLFDAARAEPAWLGVGDVVTFRAITREEFIAWK